MGHITLLPGRLILETNSTERTTAGKELLNNYLGKAIRFQQTVLEVPEQKIKSLARNDDLSNSLDSEIAISEIQEYMDELVQGYWNNWFDNPIPDLGNKTPRQAAKTKLGRERLEALLLYYEHKGQQENQAKFFKPDIALLRKELNL